MTKQGVVQAIKNLEKSEELVVERIEKPSLGSVNTYRMPIFSDWWARAKLLPQKSKKGKSALPLENLERVNSDDPERVNPITKRVNSVAPNNKEESLREEEKSASLSPVSKSVEEFEREMESKRQRREEKKLNKERGFKIHTRSRVETPKREKRDAPKGWLIFAERYRELFGMLPATGPYRWDKLKEVHVELKTIEAVCLRLEEWGDSRQSVTMYSVDDFLSGEWKIVAA